MGNGMIEREARSAERGKRRRRGRQEWRVPRVRIPVFPRFALLAPRSDLHYPLPVTRCSLLSSPALRSTTFDLRPTLFLPATRYSLPATVLGHTCVRHRSHRVGGPYTRVSAAGQAGVGRRTQGCTVFCSGRRGLMRKWPVSLIRARRLVPEAAKASTAC